MKRLHLIGAILGLAIAGGLMSCDDDVHVTPSGGSTPCTGSYCKLDKNTGEQKVAMISNPNLF